VTLVAVSTTLFSVGLRSGVIYRVSRGTWAPQAAARAAAISALALGTVGGLIGLGFYALTSGSVLQGLSPTMAIATFASLPFALAWLFLSAIAWPSTATSPTARSRSSSRSPRSCSR